MRLWNLRGDVSGEVSRKKLITSAMERRVLLDSVADQSGDVDDEGDDYETAISATGYGFFHYWLVFIGGFANASDAIEILCVSILLPAAQCDLNMTSTDKGWLSSMVFFGMMVGGYIWGCLGDIYGRRKVLMVSLVVNGLAGIISSLVQTFPAFLCFRFISGLGVGGSIPLVWAYISEFQPADRRGGALCIIASFWMVGNVLVAVFALAIIPFDIGFVTPSFSYNSWRIFLTLCALPSLMYYGLWLWFPELFNRLQQYYNEHPDDKVSVCSVIDFHGNSTGDTSPCESDKPAVDPQALVNTLITAVAPLPSNLWTIFFMDSLGRKFFLVFSMLLSGVTAFGVYFVKTSTDNIILACVFGAVSTMGFNALDCLGAELFPTHLRSTALAVTLLAARIGAIAGNVLFGYFVDVHCAVPMFMVAFLLIAGGSLGFLLPNTTRASLT
ncbi:synaptic vesicle glycoprotein 2B-like isoform X3 [Cherax quadricarinatus]|uniref:synaptic vesicle glycoprotein 2B-like isoform X3 n=1 Tax=Cherax quadricarinatus TaxID=27406 RepID=UPI00387E6854